MTYNSMLTTLTSIPKHAAYCQGTESLALRRLKIVQGANEDIAEVEKQLDKGQIEQAIEIAKDKLNEPMTQDVAVVLGRAQVTI